MARLRVRRPLIALLVLVVALVIGYAVQAARGGHHAHPAATSTSAPSTSPGDGSGHGGSSVADAPGTVALSTLPPQAAQTVRLIEAGGPFPYPRNDGVVFHNDEHLLPAEPDGYYHEYTVPTPGSGDRGARRIIAGRAGQYYYTGDHYDSFVRVDIDR